MKPPALSLGRSAVLAAASLGIAGCLMQPNFAAKMTTADGVQVEIPLSVAPVAVDDGVVSVNRVQFTPWRMEKGKGIAFAFQLGFEGGAKPVAVAVDDVSDEPILNVYADNAPVLSEKKHWNAVSPPHNAADEYAKWVMTLDNTIKVYRFTVKLADGTTHVLRYPIFVPANMKAFMRGQLGITL